MAISLRLTDDMKERIEKLVVSRNTSAHAFMLEAIREKVDDEEAQAAFRAEAERRLARMKKSGKGIPAGEAFKYLRARVSGQSAKRPRARGVR